MSRDTSTEPLAPSSAAIEAAPAGTPSSRPVLLAFLARFTDELLYGAVDVLLPTIRAALGLSYAQVGALGLALQYVAAVVEPVSALLIDAWQRRWLLAWGAAGVGVSVALVGLAPTYLVVLAAFALYGVASGPLAHTADVVLVEAEPSAPARIFARATALDTFGALLGPLLVAASVWAGLEWRWLLVALGGWGALYALLLARTRFAPPARSSEAHEGTLVRQFQANLRAVVEDRDARFWLLFLLVHDLVEAPFLFRAIWLAEEAGMSQALIGVFVAFETAAGLLGVLLLDRWLAIARARTVLLISTGAMLVLFPAWFLVPGVWARFVIGAPLGLLFAAPWPIARSASLTTTSSRPGAATALQALGGLLPFGFLVGLLASVVGLTAASLGMHLVGGAALFALAWRVPSSVDRVTTIEDDG